MGLITYLLGGPDAEARAALADLLHAAGKRALDIPSDPAEAFAERTATLAAQLELPSAPKETPSEAARVLGDRWRAERAHVSATVSGLRGTLFDVVRGLSADLGDDEEDGRALGATLDGLAAAAAAGDLDTVRRQATEAIERVRTGLARRQHRTTKQLRAMARRLEELELRAAEAESKQDRDELTQLPNRRALERRLDEDAVLAGLTGAPMTVLMLDVDHFKRFNDTHGHAAGDEVLRLMGKTLVEAFPRKSDFAARYGGEEFCVLLSDTPLDTGRRLAERFAAAVRDLRIPWKGKTLNLTCSVGVAGLALREQPRTVLGRADAALYDAKHQGRDRVVVAPSPAAPPTDASPVRAQAVPR